LTNLLCKLTFVVEVTEESLFEVVILALGVNGDVLVLVDAFPEVEEQFVFELRIIEVLDKDGVLVDLDKIGLEFHLVFEVSNLILEFVH